VAKLTGGHGVHPQGSNHDLSLGRWQDTKGRQPPFRCLASLLETTKELGVGCSSQGLEIAGLGDLYGLIEPDESSTQEILDLEKEPNRSRTQISLKDQRDLSGQSGSGYLESITEVLKEMSLSDNFARE